MEQRRKKFSISIVKSKRKETAKKEVFNINIIKSKRKEINAEINKM
jgi:uncharacterized protein YlxP (DUF503 family)